MASGVHLLGLKSDKFELVETLLQAIRERRLPMEVVLSPERYPHRLVQNGGALLDQVGNFALDPRWTTQERAVRQAGDKAGSNGLPLDWLPRCRDSRPWRSSIASCSHNRITIWSTLTLPTAIIGRAGVSTTP